ncbi:MAG: (d)CMP kinase [Synergistes sp.]|nr:(d)CMP kinase [Synergistes sp.]
MSTEENNKIVVTIDGPAGAGKSTVARAAAERVGLPYLDTGALYRAIAWKLNKEGIPAEEGEKISAALSKLKLTLTSEGIFVDGEDVTTAIRTPEVDAIVSPYAARPEVRDALIELQRAQAAGGLVADGRDMGTVVFPEAELKIFLTASAEVRAARRCKERLERGEESDYEEVLKMVIERDRIDMTREVAPLRPAPGCIILDSSDMNAEQVIDVVSSLALQYMGR